MKTTKVVAVVVCILVIAASIGWYLRNSLIQQISNRVLEKYNVVITGVSLDALATNNARISYIELVHDKGTTITIEDLSLPIGAANDLSKKYSARKVSIVTATRQEGAPFELAQLIDQFLSLPENLAGSEIHIDEFSLAPYPTVDDLHWVLTEDEQRVRASVDAVAMSATITRRDAAEHAWVFSLPSELDGAAEHKIIGGLRQTKEGTLLTGKSTLDLPSWQAIAELAHILPSGVDIQSGDAELLFDAVIPYETDLQPLLNADVTPTAAIRLIYTDGTGEATSVIVESAGIFDVEATFPDITWSLAQNQIAMFVTNGKWQSIPVTVRKLDCASAQWGPDCSMQTETSINAGHLPFGDAQSFATSSTQNIEFVEDGFRVSVQPGATILITGLSDGYADMRKFSATFGAALTLEFGNAGWRLEAGSLDANVEKVALIEDVTVTTEMFLEKIKVSDIDNVLSATAGFFASSFAADYGQNTATLPGLKGAMFLQGPALTVDASTVGAHNDGAVSMRHDLDTGSGELSIDTLELSFDLESMSQRVSPWRQNWDLNGGTVSVVLDSNWDGPSDTFVWNGQTSVGISDLSGHYKDTAFVGLTTRLDARYNQASGVVVAPSQISVALVEMGLPIENLSAAYTLDPNALAIDVEHLKMSAFGGVVRADPFRFRSQSDSNTLKLHAELIDLNEILSIKEFDTIDVSGSIAADLPVIVSADSITIVDGKLTGEAPGGVIRYRPDGDSQEVDTSSIGLVKRALSNFKYETLTSDVSYSDDGDLKLQMRITGRNPDLDESRPVVLNLGVENNVPKMLKSLQAARAVEDILEKKLDE